MVKRSRKWHEDLEKAVFSDEESKRAYEVFRLQYELRSHLKLLREKAHLTQEQVAQRMETYTPMISRLESVSSSAKHLPSLLTLMKYAEAVGYQLNISFVPGKNLSISRKNSVNKSDHP